MRQKGSNGDRLDKHDIDIKKLQQDFKKSKETFDAHLRVHIKDDLTEKRFVGSDKPRYTYDDIAEKHGIDRNVVQKIAKEEGLTRRDIKAVK